MQRLLGSKKHPKGPDFRRARLLEFDLSGTKFCMKAPPHSEPTLPPEIGPSKSNIYDLTLYSVGSEIPGAPTVFHNGHFESWIFYGLPFLKGRLERMSMTVAILKDITGSNLFNPVHFEEFVQLLINVNHQPPEGGGPKSQKRFNDYRVPLD